MTINWDGTDLTFALSRYPNGRIAVLLMAGRSLYDRLSTNMAEVSIEPDEFLVPAWNFDDEFLHRTLATGLFQDTGRRVFGCSWSEMAEGPEAQLWRIIDSTVLVR